MSYELVRLSEGLSVGVLRTLEDCEIEKLRDLEI